MAAPINGRNCRCFINDVDISRYVRRAEIVAEVDSVVTTKLELIAGVTFDEEGNIRIAGPAQLGPVQAPGLPAGLRIRGMTLTDVPST